MSMGHVLLPLYMYPDIGNWTNVANNITANPGLNFTIVVNPASGPGPKNTYPDANYISNISALNSYPNVQILGYVDTAFTARSPPSVADDIGTYRYWATYLAKHPGMDIHMDGIFFDDCSNTYTSKNYAYYKNVTTTAKQTYGFGHVLLNSGANVDSRYFALADEIIVFEDYYSNYNDDIPFNTPQQYWNQSTLLIHHFNDTGDRQQQIIDNLIGNNFQGLYISTTGDYGTPAGQYSNTGYTNGSNPNSSTNVTRDEKDSGIYEYLSNLFNRFCNDMY